MRKRFKDTVMDLAKTDDKIFMMLGDISVFLFNEYKAKYPDRFWNMGILENTLISMSAGLAQQKFNVFVHSINPFLTDRCVEQIKLDLCYNNYGSVNIVTCGASFDYAWDGATHHCYTEMAQFRMYPNMEVIQPGSDKELDLLLRSQYNNGKPTYFRLTDFPHSVDIDVKFGKGVILKDVGAPVTVMTAGPILTTVFEACKDLNVNLVYFHTIKPIDKEVIQKFAHTKILVIHDAYGLHEAINEVPMLKTKYHGLKDKFYQCYGFVHDIRKEIGIDVAGNIEFIRSELNNK